MSRKIKLVVLASCHNIGGFETKLDTIIRYLNKDKFQITVLLVYPYYKAKKIPENIRKKHKAFLSWPQVHTIEVCMNYRFDFFIIFRVASLMRKCRADILYFLALGAGTFIAPISAKIARVHFIVRANDTILEGMYPALLKKLDKMLILITDLIIVPSVYLKNLMVAKFKIGEKKIKVIPNCIDLEKFAYHSQKSILKRELNIDKNSKIVGMIANFVSVKEHTLLLKAVPEILKFNPNTYFYLIGEGPLRTMLEELADKLNITSQIEFLGYRTDVEKLIPVFDVGVLCSRVEIYPISLIEMMANGIPIVAPRVGGIPEIVSDGENGILIKQGDINQLSDAIIFFIKNNDLAKKFGEKGKNTVFEKNSIERMIQSMEDVFLNDNK